MKILLISAEVAPFAKVGGLADVAGALPKSLRELGHDVRVVMPCYKMVADHSEYGVEGMLSPFPVPIRRGVTEHAIVKRTSIRSDAGDIPVLLIGNRGTREHTGYFSEATDSTKVYSLCPEPYAFFCRAVLEMLRRQRDSWVPDVLHCNDWQSGLIPVYAHVFYANRREIASAATVFTIHNLAYQGNFDRCDWNETGLPDRLYSVDGLEFYGGWSFMKGALGFADRINTVSETYSKEIQSPGFACGLDGLMRTLNYTGRLSGILNGIDYEEYNPETDPRITAYFNANDLRGKSACKAALQAELALDVDPKKAVIGLVSRLADQKGLDLIHAIIEDMLALPIQFALLGTGDKAYEAYFKCLEERYPGRVHARIGFDVELAQRIYSGSDLFLMPSRFEPCGLGQMMALRYGTIPIVRSTGGLADSIKGFATGSQRDANGFAFYEYTPEALLDTVRAAVNLYRKSAQWKQLVRRGMSCDFSWNRSAIRYESLYKEAIRARKAGEPPLALMGEAGKI